MASGFPTAFGWVGRRRGNCSLPDFSTFLDGGHRLLPPFLHVAQKDGVGWGGGRGCQAKIFFGNPYLFGHKGTEGFSIFAEDIAMSD
jgi:hypothetical protein